MDQKTFHKRCSGILFLIQSDSQKFNKKVEALLGFFCVIVFRCPLKTSQIIENMSLNRKVVIILFSTLISANILMGIAPLNTNLGQSISKILDPVRWTIGLGQKWDMFHSIPTHHSLGVHLTANDISGKEYRYGAGLPDFSEISPRKRIRYHYTFLRLFNDPLNESFKKSYINSISRDLLEADSNLSQFTIHFAHARINSLERIRNGSGTRTEKFGPYKIQEAIKK